MSVASGPRVVREAQPCKTHGEHRSAKFGTRSKSARHLWWASRESNTAPTDYESAALTKHELEALVALAYSRKLFNLSERLG